ncbi:MAG: glycosyltransferase [Flavipsychrobacter sp.]|nr:glycosyltransferase [Flavipsychrobacter sp.]
MWITYPFALFILYPIVFFKKRKNTQHFFFFDRYELGGAQRVHIDILQSISDQKKQVYFTRLSKNILLKNEFYTIKNTSNKDIHVWCDNLFLRLFSVHYFAFFVNKHKGAQIFSSNSTFFYDMLPFLSKHVTKTDLLHNFTYGKKGMEFFGLGNYSRLDNRLCVDFYTAQNIAAQYKTYHIFEKYVIRIRVIEPGVAVPESNGKAITLPLHFFYAGRGGAQKRIYLLNKVAELCIDEALPVKFYFAGTIEDELSDKVKKHATVYGQVDKTQMIALYKQVDSIIMTSAFEGFPMLVKEGMAYGCIPLVTALEGNKTHLVNNENALLITEINDEDKLVTECMEQIKYMTTNLNETKRLSANAYNYAKGHFDRNIFLQTYRNFLLHLTTTSINKEY